MRDAILFSTATAREQFFRQLSRAGMVRQVQVASVLGGLAVEVNRMVPPDKIYIVNGGQISVIDFAPVRPWAPKVRTHPPRKLKKALKARWRR